MANFVHVFLLTSYLAELTQGKLHKPKGGIPDTWSIIRFVADKPKLPGQLLAYKDTHAKVLVEVAPFKWTKEELLPELKGHAYAIEDCDSHILYKPCGCTVVTSWEHTRTFETGGRMKYDCPTCGYSPISPEVLTYFRRLASYKYRHSSRSIESYWPLKGTFCSDHEAEKTWMNEAAKLFVLRPTAGSKKELEDAINKFFSSREEKLPPFREFLDRAA